MIHIVVALAAEAAPWIEAFSLRPRPGEGPYGVFESDACRLVVSGVGKVAAAGAVAYLGAMHHDDKTVWLNFGTAAHRQLPIGELVVGRKVIDEATGRVWHLRSAFGVRLPSASVLTVDRPAETLRGDHLYEMEAAGFVATARRWCRTDRLVCTKVISDRGTGAPEAFDPAAIRRLTEGRMDAIRQLVDELRQE